MKTAIIASIFLLTGCGLVHKPAATSNDVLESATIIGSAEHPDPVLTRVTELEKRGVVQDVVVLESFPVQIRLRAPKAVINELNQIPRTGGPR